MFIGTPHGHGERDELAAELGGAVAGAELARHAVGLAGVDGEHVPVQRAVGRGAERAEQLDLVVGERGRGSPARCPRAWCPGGAPVSSHIARSSSGVAQRLATGSPSPSLCDAGLGEREAERAGLERAAELGAHLGDLLGRRPRCRWRRGP